MNLSPMKLAEIARIAEEIRAILGDDLDGDTLIDTLDGETDAMDLIGSLIRADAEADAMADANKALAAVYQTRAKAMAERKSHVRASLAKIIEAIGEKTVRHDLGTITVKAGKPELIGQPDPDALPDDLVRIKREADRVAIRAALESGRDVPGVTLGNAAPTISIRRA